MCIVPRTPPADPSPARPLPAQARRQLALDALAGRPVRRLAARHDVSRQFVCRQLHHAHDALDEAFAPPADDPEQLLFWLPVTKPRLKQLVLGLVLVCHSSLRGVRELLTDLFDAPLSLGTVHNILQQAVTTARRRNGQEDLARIRIGAHDEIFQAGRPVLVGADVASTYCYLLRVEDHRAADTWGVRLLELTARGFRPQATIADAAPGLRAGQAAALPGVPCRGDVFHALHTRTPLARYPDNRAYGATARRSDLERRQARRARRQGRKAAPLTAQLRRARAAEPRAVALADDVAVLIGWPRDDVLAVAGADYAGRGAVYDWIVAELRPREPQCPHRLGPIRRLSENQRDDLLAFARQLDHDLGALAAEFAVPVSTVREVVQVAALDPRAPARGQRESAWWRDLGGRYPALREAVAAVTADVVRASSVLENLNSRLRNYFFLRRQRGPGPLTLLQSFLNHRRSVRGARPERVGKSPAALLTGRVQPHGLELLGYTRSARP